MAPPCTVKGGGLAEGEGAGGHGEAEEQADPPPPRGPRPGRAGQRGYVKEYTCRRKHMMHIFIKGRVWRDFLNSVFE